MKSRIRGGGGESEPRLIKARSVFARLGMTEYRGYKLLTENRFPVDVYMIGDRYYVRRADVDQLDGGGS